METWPLPEGWEWKQIAAVCEVNPRRPSIERNATTPTSFLPMAGVDEARGAITDLETRPYQEAARGYTYFEEADVLFAKITPSMQNGKSAIAQGLIDGIGFGSTEFHILRPSDEVIPEWVHLFVRQLNFRQEATQYFRGSVGQQRVPKEFLAEHLIPIPPLDVQRRIVARIEALFAELAAARHTHATLVHDAERVMDAALIDVFPPSDNQWPIYELNNKGYFEIVAGQHILSKDYSNEKIGVPYITGPADFGNKYPIISKWTESPKVFCSPDDVLLTVKGAGVGKVNCAPQNEQTCIGRQIMALRPNKKHLHRDSLYYFLQSRYETFQTMGRSATVPGISKSQIGQVKIPVPPLETQHRIVAYLDEVQAHAAALQRTAAALTADLDRTEQAILAQAFRGKL